MCTGYLLSLVNLISLTDHAFVRAWVVDVIVARRHNEHVVVLHHGLRAELSLLLHLNRLLTMNSRILQRPQDILLACHIDHRSLLFHQHALIAHGRQRDVCVDAVIVLF